LEFRRVLFRSRLLRAHRSLSDVAAGVATDGRCSHRTSSVSRRVRVYAAGCTHRGVRQAEWTPNTDRATRTRRARVTRALRGVVAMDGPSGTGTTTVAHKP